MAITRVNKLGTTTGGTGITSVSLTVGATTTAHNRVIVAVFWGASNRTVTVTDSKGNNYTQDVFGFAPGAGGWGGFFSSRADTSLVAATDTITVTWTGGTVSDAILFAYEYSGLANFSPLDVSNSASGTGSSASCALTTTRANELVIGMIGYSSSNNFSAPSQTQLDLVHGSGHSLETQEDIVAATGTYTFSGTLASTPNWLTMVAGYADTANASANDPSNTTVPVITGSGVVGMQLTCSQGLWSNTPTAYSYQWKRDGVNASTGAHYLVTTADVGHVLSCVVSASNKYGATTASASNTVTPSVNKIQAGMGI